MSLSIKQSKGAKEVKVMIDPCLSVVLESKIERKARDALRLVTRGHLQTLDDAWVALVLKARIFAFGIFANDGEIDVGVSSGKTRKRLAKNNGSINIELLAHCYVPRDVTGLRDGSEENSCTDRE